MLAARSMPVEGKQRIAAAGNALDTALDGLLDWMKALDAGLGQSGETAAGKIRYQMNRMRELSANFELQKETSARPSRTVHRTGALSRRRATGARARRGLLLRPLWFRPGRRYRRAGRESLPPATWRCGCRRSRSAPDPRFTPKSRLAGRRWASNQPCRDGYRQ